MSTHPPTLNKPSVPASGIEHDALPPGTRFGEFEILRVLGVGGFGIVYLAKDHSLEREVALKEYMPASLAARGAGPQITVRSSSFAETYAIGLRSFINEARLLARFDHPSLVKVYRFWEDNATAYMVMPYLQGVTLRDMRRGMAHPPDEAWIKSVIMPILSALELLHREGVYHRDIAPDNILLPPDGPPVLLDFGAARRVISDRTQSLTAILKPSYAPIEQYAEMTQLRQGPWTDLYALGAVVHYLLFGAPPAPATARAVQDDADAIERRIVPGVSPRFLEAMSWMLAIRPNQRPQSGEQLRAVLDGSADIPARGRPGITIPASLAPASPMATTKIEPAADATQVNTAYMPTFMPTAHVAPAGAAKAAAVEPAFSPTTFAPTTFTPATQMPTARVAPSQAEAAPSAPSSPAVTRPAPPPTAAPAVPPAARTAPPRTAPSSSAPPGQAAANGAPTPSRPAPLAPTPSRPAPLAPSSAGSSARSEGRATRPAALPSGFGPSSSFGANAGPGSRPAPLAGQPARAPVAAKAGPSSKTWLAVAAGGVAVAVAAFAAWQYSTRSGDAAALASAAAASAAASPVVTAIPSPPPTAVTPMPTMPTTPNVATNTALPASSLPAEPKPTEAVSRLPAAGADPLARPAQSDRASLASGSVDRTMPAASTAASGARVRPPGRPVPRVDDPTTASTSTPNYRSGDTPPFGTSGTNASERPRPSVQAPLREAVVAQKPPPVVVDPGPLTAREACGKRVFISLAICMDERCELPRYRASQECVEILARKAERANR